MKLLFSFLEDLEKAKKENWPLIIPAGNIEYHGPHCVYGCDVLIVEGIARELEKEENIVIAPTIAYGPSSYAASGSEKGTIHVNMSTFERHVYDILRNYLDAGWRNIYILIHHQYDNEMLFPMTLCYMKAASQLIFEYIEEKNGQGWFANLDKTEDFRKWKGFIKVLPTMSKEVQQSTGYDHAGKWECSLINYLYPGTVRVENIKNNTEWFAQSAIEYSNELGSKMLELIIKDLKNKIK